jgi:hypothetical protein
MLIAFATWLLHCPILPCPVWGGALFAAGVGVGYAIARGSGSGMKK